MPIRRTARASQARRTWNRRECSAHFSKKELLDDRLAVLADDCQVRFDLNFLGDDHGSGGAVFHHGVNTYSIAASFADQGVDIGERLVSHMRGVSANILLRHPRQPELALERRIESVENHDVRAGNDEHRHFERGERVG